MSKRFAVLWPITIPTVPHLPSTLFNLDEGCPIYIFFLLLLLLWQRVTTVIVVCFANRAWNKSEYEQNFWCAKLLQKMAF